MKGRTWAMNDSLSYTIIPELSSTPGENIKILIHRDYPFRPLSIHYIVITPVVEDLTESAVMPNSQDRICQ